MAFGKRRQVNGEYADSYTKGGNGSEFERRVWEMSRAKGAVSFGLVGRGREQDAEDC